MILTRQRTRRNPDDFPTTQLFLLAIVRLAEPIALTSIFPYAWALIKRFQVGDEDDASFYAGVLISSFSLAEALMGMYWGGLSDRTGRKPVLLLGCFGTMVSMVMVGFASNLWMALLARVAGGLLNGNIGVIQTMVGELVTKPEHEPRAYSIMPFVWSIGTIIGPAIGGTFADPHASFPNVFPESSLFARFPYLLPNLLCAVLLLISILLGHFLLDETHADMQPPRIALPDQDMFVSEETPLMKTSDALKRPAVDLRDGNYGSMKNLVTKRPGGDLSRTINGAAKRPLCDSLWSKRIVAVMVALSIFSYHSMTFDHLLPIFLEDDRAQMPSPVMPHGGSWAPSWLLSSPGGLDLSLRSVGMIMAVNGAIALFMQAVVFPLMADRIGVHRLFLWVTMFHPVAYVLVPWLLYVPDALLYPAIYACLAVRNFFSILVYPLLLMLIKEATPSASVLGKVNGLAASAGATCRMIAPPAAGYLYAVGKRHNCTALAWYGSALVAVVGAVQCLSVQRGRTVTLMDEEARTPVGTPGKQGKQVVRVSILDADDEEL